MALRLDGKCEKCDNNFSYLHGETNQTKQVNEILEEIISGTNFLELSSVKKSIIERALVKDELEIINQNKIDSARFYLNTYFINNEIVIKPIFFIWYEKTMYRRDYINHQALEIQKNATTLKCPKCNEWNVKITKMMEVI